MTKLLFAFLQKQPIKLDEYRETLFHRSGCRGLIKFSLIGSEDRRDELQTGAKMTGTGEESYRKLDGYFLRMLPSDQIEVTLPNFRELLIAEGEILIRKGELNHNLYLVGSGELLVEDDGQPTAVATGELCGELKIIAEKTGLYGSTFGLLPQDERATEIGETLWVCSLKGASGSTRRTIA